MKKGGYVSKSVYQKVCEEKKKLLEDIRIMSSESFSYKKIITVQKWRGHFNRDDSFKLMLKGLLKQHHKSVKLKKKVKK